MKDLKNIGLHKKRISESNTYFTVDILKEMNNIKIASNNIILREKLRQTHMDLIKCIKIKI